MELDQAVEHRYHAEWATYAGAVNELSNILSTGRGTE